MTPIRIVTILVAFCLIFPWSAFAATIQLPSTGQTACYDASGYIISCTGTGQDGEKLKGVATPNPRFADNDNGTVTDNLTGLIWLKDANCFNLAAWSTAVISANTLANGICGLGDGSTAGQWRLPDRKELMSLVDRSKLNPALPAGHPSGNSVQSGYYWSSSTDASDTDYAWYVDMNDGTVNSDYNKTNSYYFWPVRGGQ